MELNKSNQSDKKFITVLADGKFHQTVAEGTEGAVVRVFEDSEGVEQSKTELVFDEVVGVITEIAFEEGKFGKSIQLTIDNEGIVSFSTQSSFGEDLMKKLPNIKLDESVRLVPYSFVPKGEESKKKGITVYQDGLKVGSYYWLVDENDKTKGKSVNGIPEVEGDSSKFDSDDWKMHFMKVRKFLIKEIEKLPKYVVREVKENKEVKEF
jgi:hypothetical protein